VGPAIIGFGKEHKELMEQFRHLSMYGAMISDETRGRVLGAISGSPIIWYNINKKDKEKMLKAILEVSRVLLAAGAKKVFPAIQKHNVLTSIDEIDRIDRSKVRATDLEMMAFHPMGTARMGKDPGASVVDPNLESHEIKGLFVADASVFPSSLGVNPQLTIMAFAKRAAEYIVKNKANYIT